MPSMPASSPTTPGQSGSRSRRTGALVAVLGVVLLAAGLGSCGDPAAGRAFEPVEADTLTVATAVLPAPGFWEGPVDGRYRGFEADLVHELADRLGLDRVEVIEVPFEDLVTGDLGGADLGVSQLSPSAEREEVLSFSAPYLRAAPAVLARAGTGGRDTEAIRDLRWVVRRASTLTTVVSDRIRPTDEPLRVETRAEALESLRDDRADAVLLDLPVALALAESEPETFEVLGQLRGVEALAAALPDGSDNVEVVSSAFRAMTADGTIDSLSDRWLGGTGDDVPLIRTTD